MAQDNKSTERLKGFTSQLAKLTAKIVLRFNIKYRNFLAHFKRELVKEARRQHPDYRNVQLAMRTGVDRRAVSEALKAEDDAPIWNGKDLLVLQRIQEFCTRNAVTMIPKNRGFESFKSICETSANGTLTAEAIATELMRIGAIKSHGRFYKVSDQESSARTQQDEIAMQRLIVGIGYILNELNWETSPVFKRIELHREKSHSLLKHG